MSDENIFLHDLRNFELKTHAYFIFPFFRIQMDDEVKNFENSFIHMSALQTKNLLEKCIQCNNIIHKEECGTLALEIFGYILIKPKKEYQQRVIGRILCSKCFPLDYFFVQFYASSSGFICWKILHPLEEMNKTMRILYSFQK